MATQCEAVIVLRWRLLDQQQTFGVVPTSSTNTPEWYQKNNLLENFSKSLTCHNNYMKFTQKRLKANQEKSVS